MTDLTDKEQAHVRTALLFLRRRFGGWASLARALGFQYDTVEKVANARGRSVTASMALRVARLIDTPVDDLLAGRWLPGRTCPHCGCPPADFADEETVVDDRAVREAPPLRDAPRAVTNRRTH